MHELAQRLLRTIRKQELLHAGDRAAVAVSGGADSVALLRLLEELRAKLGIVLSVAHVNHKLRGAESDEDEQFVAALAALHGLEFHAIEAPVMSKRSSVSANREGSDAPATSGIEAAARKLRYDFFRKLAKRERIVRIATAHTLDDQAETVLLRMFRGTGIRGLAGIHPRLPLFAREKDPTTNQAGNDADPPAKDGGWRSEVVRPLLGFRRTELRDYLHSLGQNWREDSSNENVAFLRNRVRRKLLPLIAEQFGVASIEHLAELAEIARAEDEWCSAEFRKVDAAKSLRTDSMLNVQSLLDSGLAMRRRLVRAWLEANVPEASISFRLIEDILELARAEAGKKLDLPWTPTCQDETAKDPDAAPAKISLRRRKHDIALERDPSRQSHDYQYRLTVPGEVSVPELETSIEMRMVDVARVPEDERYSLLDLERVGAEVVIRNWRSGDRYWPAHTSTEKKVKELLTDLHVSGPEKKLWPVAVARESQIVWMRGFAVPEVFQAQTGTAILIREVELWSRSKR